MACADHTGHTRHAFLKLIKGCRHDIMIRIITNDTSDATSTTGVQLPHLPKLFSNPPVASSTKGIHSGEKAKKMPALQAAVLSGDAGAKRSATNHTKHITMINALAITLIFFITT